MRRRSAPLEVFNLSALDLFASALGAFIVLAVVALPYFPKVYSDQPAEPREVIDLVIVLDSTGSMGAEIAEIREDLKVVADLLGLVSETPALGIIDFEDAACPSNGIRSHALVTLSPSSLRSLQSFADSIEPGSVAPDGTNCNTSNGEALSEGLQAATQLAWRPEASRHLIIVVTDEGAHPSSRDAGVRAAESFAARHALPAGGTWRIFCGGKLAQSSTGASLDFTQDCRTMAERGGGEFVSLDSDELSFIAFVMRAVLSD